MSIRNRTNSRYGLNGKMKIGLLSLSVVFSVSMIADSESLAGLRKGVFEHIDYSAALGLTNKLQYARRHRIAVAAVENGVAISKEEFLERRVGFRDTKYIDLGRYYAMAAEEGGVCSVGKVVRNASHLEEKRKAAEAGLVITYGVVPGKSIGEKVPIEYSHVIIDGDEERESCSQLNYATVPEPNAALLLLIGLAGLALKRRSDIAKNTYEE